MRKEAIFSETNLDKILREVKVGVGVEGAWEHVSVGKRVVRTVGG